MQLSVNTINGIVYMKNGIVKWFSVRREYGFIEKKDGKGVFIHYPEINLLGFKALFAVDKVSFDIERPGLGRRAINDLKI